MMEMLAASFRKNAKVIGFICIALMVLLGLEGVFEPRRLAFDFANFYDAGHKALVGEHGTLYDEFAQIDGQDPFGNMLYFGVPISSLFFAPLAFFEPATAAILFKLFNLICIFSGLLLLYRRFYPYAADTDGGKDLFFALFCIGALLFQPFWTVFHVGGQTTPFLFLILTIGLLAFEKERYWLAGVLYALAVLIKPAFAPGAGLLFLFAPWRFKLWSAGAGAVSMIASVLALGWPIHQEFLDLLREHSGSLLVIPYHNAHPVGWLEPAMFGPADYASLESRSQPALLAGLNLGFRVAVIGLMLGFMWRFTSGAADSSAKRTLIFVATLFAGLVYAPVVWPHYLALLFVLVVYVIAMQRHFSRAAMALLGLVVLSAPLQHIWMASKIVGVLAPMGQFDSLVLTFLRGTTMTLMLALVLVFRKSFANSLRDPVWSRAIV